MAKSQSCPSIESVEWKKLSKKERNRCSKIVLKKAQDRANLYETIMLVVKGLIAGVVFIFTVAILADVQALSEQRENNSWIWGVLLLFIIVTSLAVALFFLSRGKVRSANIERQIYNDK